MKPLADGTWVAVCDGSKAMLLENAGESDHPSLVMRDALTQDNPPTSKQGTDAPGRAISRARWRRAAVQQTDFHDLAEREFLRRFAARINQGVADADIRALVLIAPPRALGMLRPALHSNSRQAVKAELAHDYAKKPLCEIERLLLENSEKGDVP